MLERTITLHGGRWHYGVLFVLVVDGLTQFQERQAMFCVSPPVTPQ
jgi:hypothetical protein